MAIINTSSELLAVLTSNASFFQDVMTHEFGHVLGIGSLWGTEQSSSGTTLGRNFVNRSAGTYSVNTYAGWYYGELLDTYAQTALPVTTGEGEGSDYSHWREQIFDSELMTHQAESTTTNMPLSQLTIAALRDLGYNVNYGAAEPYSLTSTTGSGTSA
jgi:hypothetical protein